MKEAYRWIAIGDSFTYLNDHLDETAYRVSKGYLDRVLEKVPGLELFNMGINGSTTNDWQMVNIPKADLYTVLLGTNDWFHDVPLGTEEDFKEARAGSILGNLGCMLRQIRKKAPGAKVIVMNPVARGEFVYVGDGTNNAHSSALPENGVMLKDVAAAIYHAVKEAGIPCIDLWTECGFTEENAVKFKRVRTPEGYRDMPWPDYTCYRFEPGEDVYPYPPEAADRTYDGLHPSDLGNEIIAEILSKKIREVLGR